MLRYAHLNSALLGSYYALCNAELVRAALWRT